MIAKRLQQTGGRDDLGGHWAIHTLIFGFLVFNSGGASREGSYRRGVGWYLDVSTPRDTLMPGAYGKIPIERTSLRLIRLSLISGGLFGIGTVIAAAFGEVGLAILLGVYAVCFCGLGWDGIRRNRRADQAATGD
jgi:hypothetical protein